MVYMGGCNIILRASLTQHAVLEAVLLKCLYALGLNQHAPLPIALREVGR